MKKATLIGVILAITIILVVSIFVSAHLTTEEKFSESDEIKIQPTQTCNANTCNFECGGNCGVPNCGCGR